MMKNGFTKFGLLVFLVFLGFLVIDNIKNTQGFMGIPIDIIMMIVGGYLFVTGD
jgi:hypothetical protein